MTCFQYFSVVLLAFLTSHLEKRVSGAEPCMKKIFADAVPNKALINHVISTPTVTSDEGCNIQCFIEIACESYNFGPKEGGGHVCELSDSDAIRDPLDWITKQGFLYVGTQNPCAKAQCPVNARCHSDFEYDTYACVCMPGFTGNHCEDVDECTGGLHGCHSNATCQNTEGSYNCTCKPRFLGNGLNCEPVAEGTLQELAVLSCQSLSTATHTSGIYWVDPDGGSHDNAFKVYCEMETDGGGWTLVWSYTFTDYDNFASETNAVYPRPNWPIKLIYNATPVSTTPPLNETDYNAMNFSLWKQFGSKVLIKSNINNWIVCSPSHGGRGLVKWTRGGVFCNITKRVSGDCLQKPPPSFLNIAANCGPVLRGNVPGQHYYNFDCCTRRHTPWHDPCGKSKDNGVKNVENPHGNIFIRANVP